MVIMGIQLKDLTSRIIIVPFFSKSNKKNCLQFFFNKIETNSSPHFFRYRAAYIHEIRVMTSFLYNYLFCHFSNGLKSGMHSCMYYIHFLTYSLNKLSMKYPKY